MWMRRNVRLGLRGVGRRGCALDWLLGMRRRGVSSSATSTVKVAATYTAHSVDVVGLRELVESRWSGVETAMADRDWVVFRVPAAAYAGEEGDPRGHPVVHLSASRRGSVVVTHTCGLRDDRHEEFSLQALLPEVRVSGSGVGVVGLRGGVLGEQLGPVKEELEVEVGAAGLGGEWCAMRDGELLLRALDLDSVRILNSCMAQTVNLQFFESRVEQMHDFVGHLHASLEDVAANEETLLGSFQSSITRLLFPSRSTLSSSQLFRQLGAVNAITNAVLLSGLRATVRPGSAAWKEDRYAKLQELLWEELDLEERYSDVQRKLEFIDDSIRYSLDVAKDAKFILLERLVVLLIMAELITSSIAGELHVKIPQLLLGA